MTNLEKYMISNWLVYAAAFEQAIDDKEWTQVIECFHPQGTYTRHSDDERLHTPTVKGNKNVAANFEGSVENFDRQCTSRNLKSINVACVGDLNLKHHFHIIYKKDGLPDLEFSGYEDYTFNAQGLIVSLVEVIDPGVGTKLIEWLMLHGSKR
jgi:hypothetical protein